MFMLAFKLIANVNKGRWMILNVSVGEVDVLTVIET